MRRCCGWRRNLAREPARIAEAEADVAGLEQKLGNEQFTARAPAEVVQRERDRLETTQSRLAGLRQSLAEIG